MDRGFADFRTDDVQVAISPDKRDIFVTISVTEGDRYTISDVKLAGEMVVPARAARSPDARAARPDVLAGRADAERGVHGACGSAQDGYAFAEIRAVPELNEETKEASITFFVDPRNRVYVRRINFNGADNVNDEVFRREMRQLEGGYLSNTLVDRSKLLAAAAAVRRVGRARNDAGARQPGPRRRRFRDRGGPAGAVRRQPRLLRDVRRHARRQFHSLELHGYRAAASRSSCAAASIRRSTTSISRTRTATSTASRARYRFTYQDITQYTSVTSDFSTTTLAAGMNWGYPIANFQRMTFGFAYQDAELLTSHYGSLQGARMGAGERRIRSQVLRTCHLRHEGARAWISSPVGSTTRAMRRCFRPRAARLSMGLNMTVPGSDVEYYVATVDFTKYVPLFGRVAVQSQQRAVVRRGVRRHDRDTAVPEPLRRRARLGARFQGKLLSARGIVLRQSVRRQPAVRESVRADHPDAGEDRGLDANRVVFRRRRRVLDGRRQVLRQARMTLWTTTSTMIG